MSLKYRADIQILRGLAVFVVVIFHISPTIMPTGYFGVDIFFVISGFLMCSLYKPNSAGKLISDFYFRRFTRIIPAYLTIIAICLVLGSYIFVPYEFSKLVEQSLAAVMGIPNILLWSGESYFDEFAFRPLLHLWSLGVEIQFYIIVPLIYLVITRSKKLFLFLIVASFVSCILVASISSKTAFFMLPFRMWEFLMGFAVAYYFSVSGNVRTNKFSRYGLFSFILLSFFCVVPVPLGPHPGISALILCTLTSIVLLVGLPINVLSSRIGKIFECFGRYSYSLYLVHFPILIFMYHNPFGGETINSSLDLHLLLTVILIISSTLLLYNLVENKNWRVTFKSNKAFSIILLLIGFATIPISYAINNNSYTKIEKEITFAPLDRSVWRCGKYEKLMRVINPNHLTCSLLDLDNATISENILLIGDSHADAIKQSIANVARKRDSQVYFMIESCNLGEGDCRTEKILTIVKDKKISKIILHDFHKNIDLKQILTLSHNISQKDLSLYYVDPIPVYSSSVPKYLFENQKYNHEISDFKKNRSDFEFKYKSIHEGLNKLDIIRIPTLETLCNPQCQITTGTAPIYADSHHLTLTGAKKLEPIFDLIIFPH